MADWVSLSEASDWATNYLGREVKKSNISYLVRYGVLSNRSINRTTKVSLTTLKNYYDRKLQFPTLNGSVNSNHFEYLAFNEYTEKERTKHVHRLHPYKGKFIPQLVEYFLDDHTDDLKREVWFKPGDVILDPFCGSGTTLVQAGELGMHAVGIDISEFNTLISNTKVSQPNLILLYKYIRFLIDKLRDYNATSRYIEFDERVSQILSSYNKEYFPSPTYRNKVAHGRINEREYSQYHHLNFLKLWNKCKRDYDILLMQKSDDSFLSTWYVKPIRDEIEFLHKNISCIADKTIRDILLLVLTRTMRTCRATTHADLATLKSPVFEPYYCRKHNKICKPLLTASKWWERYALESIARIAKYESLRSQTNQICLTGDARTSNIEIKLKQEHESLYKVLTRKGIRGIFSSPPYVGLIDYHEQHAYAYELLNLPRRDSKEIGPLSSGQGKEARDSYVEGIAQVLRNCKKYLVSNYDVFLVANDKWNLYSRIAQKSGMRIVGRYERPVLNRTEKNRNSRYSETIFHLKDAS